MHLKTLGGLELSGGSLSRPKPLLLLAYLTLEGPKDRRHLGELFYAETKDPAAGLRVALQHLRGVAAGALTAKGPTVGSAVPSDAPLLLGAAERLDHPEVVRLYQGTFLDGVHLDWSPELEEWVLGTREHLAGLARRALLALGEAEEDARAAAGYAARAYRLSAAPPLEPEQLLLSYGLLQAGGHPDGAALRQEIADLGMPPPPRASALARVQAPNNLNAPATSFVGRQAELARLTEHLETAQTRLLTLAGAGGMGKTRLALELARAQLERPRWDGIYLVALGALRDAAFIPAAIAGALGYRLHGRTPPLDELLGHIGRQRLLLVLDNFEQFMTGRDMTGRDMVARLVRDCPEASLVVTSRERLGLSLEAVYPVDGLDVDGLGVDGPDLGERDAAGAEPAASAQLFVERARSADLHFRLDPDTRAGVLDICRLLGGSPLGIELAAAWVRFMPPSAIAQQLGDDLDFLAARHHDAPERHRSLRAVFEHSWRLLSEQEQAVLKRLSVFRGGFRREAAAAVAHASIPVLAALLDKSLLRVLPSGRYDRHPLVYQFAAEKLAEIPSEQRHYAARHARYVLALAEEAEGELRTAAQPRWLERLAEEGGNVRAALAWALEQRQLDLSLRLASALGLYWYVGAAFEEGRVWFERVLAQPRLPRTRLHARALHGAGRLERSAGDFARAEARLARALALFEDLNDAAGVADCLNELGILAAAQADYAAALPLFGRGHEAASDLGDEARLIITAGNFGLAHALVGNLNEAERLNEQSLDLSRRHGNAHGVAHALNNLALTALQADDRERALRFYSESWDTAQTLNNRRLMAEALLGRGNVNGLMGSDVEARVYIKRGLELYRAQHDKLGVIDGLLETAQVAASRAPLLAARLCAATDLARGRLNFPLRPFARQRYEAALDRARAEVPEREFRTAWAEGELWTLDEAAERALSWLDLP